jgi:hypothetical protein
MWDGLLIDLFHSSRLCSIKFGCKTDWCIWNQVIFEWASVINTYLMVWEKRTRTTKPKVKAINLECDFTLQSITDVREYLRVTTCFDTAKELLKCIYFIFQKAFYETIRQGLSWNILLTAIKPSPGRWQHITLYRHCILPVSFAKIAQFIQHVSENIDNFDLRNGRLERNVWEMQTYISWESLSKMGGNIKLTTKR